MVDKQLDALKSSELDKELVHSLRLSTQAMKKAGISGGVKEVESVMDELDQSIHEVEEMTNVLGAPIGVDPMESESVDIDAELGLIEEEDAELLGGVSRESVRGQGQSGRINLPPVPARATCVAPESPATMLIEPEREYRERPARAGSTRAMQALDGDY